ncbi:MAG: hypothetical protein ACKO04_06720, partial [Actinomycetes bacterium]
FVGLTGQALLALCIGVAAASGKQAFDAVVQRDAPDANRGRSFARFESRFQVAWVCGAFVPVVITMPTRLGGAVVMVMAAVAAVVLFLAVRALDRGEAPLQIPAASVAARRALQRRRAEAGSPGADGPGRPAPDAADPDAVDPGAADPDHSDQLPPEAAPAPASTLEATEEMEPPSSSARPKPFDVEAELESVDLVGATAAQPAADTGLREVPAPPPEEGASDDEPFDGRLF